MNELVQSIRTDNWAAIIQERQDSGQTIKQWCAENNISEGAYYYRLRQLREKLLQTMQPSDAETKTEAKPVLVKIPDTVTTPAVNGTALRIRKGSAVIEVSNDASESILTMMKEVLLHA